VVVLYRIQVRAGRDGSTLVVCLECLNGYLEDAGKIHIVEPVFSQGKNACSSCQREFDCAAAPFSEKELHFLLELCDEADAGDHLLDRKEEESVKEKLRILYKGATHA
jgi:hypothetical protein